MNYKYILPGITLICLLSACDSKEYVAEQTSQLGFTEIIQSKQTNRDFVVSYMRDSYENCYMVIYSPNGNGSTLSATTIPCSSIIKPKKEGCE